MVADEEGEQVAVRRRQLQPPADGRRQFRAELRMVGLPALADVVEQGRQVEHLGLARLGEQLGHLLPKRSEFGHGLQLVPVHGVQVVEVVLGERLHRREFRQVAGEQAGGEHGLEHREDLATGGEQLGEDPRHPPRLPEAVVHQVQVRRDRLTGAVVQGQPGAAGLKKEPHEQVGALAEFLRRGQPHRAAAHGDGPLEPPLAGGGAGHAEDLEHVLEEQVGDHGHGLQVGVDLAHEPFHPALTVLVPVAQRRGQILLVVEHQVVALASAQPV